MKAAVFLASMILFPVSFCYANNEIEINVGENTDITVERYKASGKTLFLWIGPEYGVRRGHRMFAKNLARAGHEVWIANIIESLFLSHNSNAMRSIPGTLVSQLIKEAHRRTNKEIVLVGNSYATIPLLRGAHAWQSEQIASRYLVGAILFTPSAFVSVPSLGAEPEFMPVVSATNIPIMIFMASKNSSRWQLNALQTKLQQHNNPVYTKILKDIVGIYYDEDNIEGKKLQYIQELPGSFNQVVALLKRYPVPVNPVPFKTIKTRKQSGIDIFLKKYRGITQPIEINLPDSNNKIFHKNDFRGKVTVLNFWATWCPPCVEEIPSLNRLKEKMQDKPFELISINYAEDKKTIREFLQKVDVDFPVLLDHNGQFSSKWNVVAYPSTFVIGMDGKIKYGVNAAIEWDDDRVVKIINKLISQP